MIKKIAISVLSAFVIMTSCYYVAFSDYYMENTQTNVETSMLETSEPILVAHNDETINYGLNLTKKEIENEYNKRYKKIKEELVTDMRRFEIVDNKCNFKNDSETALSATHDRIIALEAVFENEYHKIHSDMNTLLTYSGFSTEAVGELERDVTSLKRKIKISIIKEAAFGAEKQRIY